MYKTIVFAAVLAVACCAPEPKANPGVLAAYAAPVVAAPAVSYTAAYSAPLAAAGYFASPYAGAYSAYSAYPAYSPYAADYIVV